MKKFTLLGIISGLSMPPICLFPVIILSYGEIFNLLVDPKKDLKTKLKSLSLFLFSFNACSMYWLYKPFLVADMYVLAMPFILSILFAYLSLYHLLAGYIFTKTLKLITQNQHIRILSFAALFTASDILISTLFGGFPWNLIGYSASKTLSFIQSAFYLKIYGLNFLFYIIGSYLTLFIKEKERKFLFISAVLIITNFSYGFFKLYQYTNNITLINNPIKIGLIQTAIPQNQKWNLYFAKKTLNTLIDLSNKVHNADLIIWPEASFPYNITQDSNLARIFSDFSEKNHFFIGTIFHNNNKYYNSIVYLDNNKKIKNIYHKIKLTPFGEYIPFRFIPIIDLISNDARDFSSGTNREYIEIKNKKFYPLICYEIIFPLYNINADYIVNISNDAWFENTIGIQQLYYITRFRAVEASTPIIRVSNRGISVIFNERGEEILETKSNKECSIYY